MLYNQADKREYERREFLATLICGPLKKKKDDGFKSLEYNGDPKSVEHLSAEEREAMTQRLMEQFKNMGSGKGLVKG